jgi:predicted metal-binding protein
MCKSLFDKFILIISNLLINNIVENDKDIVMYNNIVCYSCTRDSKIKKQK